MIAHNAATYPPGVLIKGAGSQMLAGPLRPDTESSEEARSNSLGQRLRPLEWPDSSTETQGARATRRRNVKDTLLSTRA
jgi:hypothetical protein